MKIGRFIFCYVPKEEKQVPGIKPVTVFAEEAYYICTMDLNNRIPKVQKEMKV